MPIKPRPMRVCCRQCGWETIYAPPSDVMIPPPPLLCAQCGSPDLIWEPADLLASIAQELLAVLRKR